MSVYTKTTKAALDNRPQWIYKIYKDSHLMYIGLTCNLLSAQARHKGRNLMPGDRVVLRFAGYSRQEARAIEKKLVQKHSPLLNKTTWG